jgi:hypothetical protein
MWPHGPGKYRKKVWLGFGWLAAAVCTFCLVIWSIEYHQYRQARQYLAAVELGVGLYSVEHEGLFPASLDQLATGGYLRSLPVSPYTGEPALFLEPGDPPSAGGIVYIPWDTPAEASATGKPSPASSLSGNNPAPAQQFRKYLLVIYREKPYRLFRFSRLDLQFETSNRLKQLDQTRVACLLSSQDFPREPGDR